MSQSIHSSSYGTFTLPRETPVGGVARGGATPERRPEGRFDTMFDNLQIQEGSFDDLDELGKKGGHMDEVNEGDAAGDSQIPAGFTFVGQFIDHDITFDTESKIKGMNQVAREFDNFRTANLDLDCVYGTGPEALPFMYDSATRKLHLGDRTSDDTGHDLPRFKGRALIGDPRNDENILVSQLQLAFLKFHNQLIDDVDASITDVKERFKKARRTAIYYYHKMILEDFLPRIIGPRTLAKVLAQRHFYYPQGFGGGIRHPFMPSEFAMAAYRYGHSQVRGEYTLNQDQSNIPLFGAGAGFDKSSMEHKNLVGFEPAFTYVDWRYFFDNNDSVPTQFSRKIDTHLPGVLMELPVPSIIDDGITSLASRNLMRGRSFNMWSGESVAQHMIDIGVGDVTKLPTDDAVGNGKLTGTPLWYYVLQEARDTEGGLSLGTVGGTIVGEVLVGLIEHHWAQSGYDMNAYQLGCTVPQEDSQRFMMTDILKYAGVMPG